MKVIKLTTVIIEISNKAPTVCGLATVMDAPQLLLYLCTIRSNKLWYLYFKSACSAPIYNHADSDSNQESYNQVRILIS